MVALLVLLVLFVWTAILTYKAMERRSVPLGTPVTLILLGAALLPLFCGLEFISPTFQTMFLSITLQYVALGFLFLGLGLLFFNYMGWVDQWDRRSVVLLSIMPIVFILLVATDPWTSFYYQSLTVSDFNGYSFLETERAWGYWVLVTYVTILLLGIFYLIVRSLLGALETNTKHMTVLLLAIIGSMVMTL